MLSEQHQRSSTVQEEGLTNEGWCHFRYCTSKVHHSWAYFQEIMVHISLYCTSGKHLSWWGPCNKVSSNTCPGHVMLKQKKKINPLISSSPPHPLHSHHHTITLWNDVVRGTIRWNPAPLVPPSKAPPCEGWGVEGGEGVMRSERKGWKEWWKGSEKNKEVNRERKRRDVRWERNTSDEEREEK